MTKINKMDDLIEIEELMNFLGYKSERSVLSWCRKNNISIQTFGKKKYADAIAFKSLISKSLGIENRTDFTKGHRPTDNIRNPGPGSSNSKPHGEAAQNFLNKFKSEENEKGAGHI